MTRYTEGFSHFVTSMTAPVASGWSGCRVGLAPTGKRRLSRRTPKADLAKVDRAIADLRSAGAEIIDPFTIPKFDQFVPRLHPLSEVRVAIEGYLAKTGPKFPKTLAAVMASGKFHPLHEVGLRETAAAPVPEEDPAVTQLEADEAGMRAAYIAAMDEFRIDALAFPTATYPPKLNGDRNTTPAGMLSGIASALHWPAAVVPMG